ncbi:polysaccharide deacetylase family protein [Cohnella pontilimi]|uniref:Polysaccharide deacetylase family protein n=1 Tax=Cohnella pontilimi TaxID=2564100 RepID=A0A4V5LRT0_9BACL|nr:polysaccharide deacetylase family protein [Cohnella pontilimi]TJY39769.1 polysaccharide deacetylase family protein [Cohnella pontilimi]
MASSRWLRVAMSLTGAVTLLFLSAFEKQAAGKPDKMPWSELQRRYHGVFVLSATRETRKVALTFDDVPDPRYTPKVLDILKKKKVRATFFVVGSRTKKHPGLVKRIHREGHVIGNHSYFHPDFSKLPLGKMQEQIRRTETLLLNVVGFKPRLIRPPYGEILQDQVKWAKKERYTVVNWDVDSYDWKQLTGNKIYRNVTRTVRPGSVVLMHAGGGAGQNLSGTVDALPRIIDWLRNNGYELVTLTELLDVPEQHNLNIPLP